MGHVGMRADRATRPNRRSDGRAKASGSRGREQSQKQGFIDRHAVTGTAHRNSDPVTNRAAATTAVAKPTASKTAPILSNRAGRCRVAWPGACNGRAGAAGQRPTKACMASTKSGPIAWLTNRLRALPAAVDCASYRCSAGGRATVTRDPHNGAPKQCCPEQVLVLRRPCPPARSAPASAVQPV